MQRNQRIQQLVERKLKDKTKARSCVCFGMMLCISRGQRTTQASPRS
jgi:hypothetical protein